MAKAKKQASKRGVEGETKAPAPVKTAVVEDKSTGAATIKVTKADSADPLEVGKATAVKNVEAERKANK